MVLVIPDLLNILLKMSTNSCKKVYAHSLYYSLNVVETFKFSLIYFTYFIRCSISFIIAIGDYYYDPDETSRDKKKGPLVDVTVPYYLGKFEEIAKQNNGYLANGKVSNCHCVCVCVKDGKRVSNIYENLL